MLKSVGIFDNFMNLRLAFSISDDIFQIMNFQLARYKKNNLTYLKIEKIVHDFTIGEVKIKLQENAQRELRKLIELNSLYLEVSHKNFIEF